MIKTPRVEMSAKWQGREEPPKMMAARIRAFLTLSRSPPGRSWHCIIPPRPETPEEAERFDRYCDLGANSAYVDDHVANAGGGHRPWWIWRELHGNPLRLATGGEIQL